MAAQGFSKRSVTVVAGLSGYGKNTFLLRYLVNAQLAARYLFDPDPGEFNPDLGEFADRLKLNPTVTPYELSLHLVRGWVCFDPHTLFPGDPTAGADFFCDWAYETGKTIPGEKAIVIDEIWAHCTTQKIPHGIRKMALSGRKVRTQLFALTQEPQRLNETFKGACSEVVLFRLQSEKQLAFAREFGFDPVEIAQLPRLHWVARNIDSGGELRGAIKV